MNAVRRHLRRAFSAVELAICVSVLAILVPIVYRVAAGYEDQQALALWDIDTAEATRGLAETLRLDAHHGTPVPGSGVAWASPGCTVEYRVTDEHSLLRDACGEARVLARNVATFERSAGGVDVSFRLPLRGNRDVSTHLFVPVEQP